MEGIRDPIEGALLAGNNLITAAVVPTSAAIGLHFYPLWDAASIADENESIDNGYDFGQAYPTYDYIAGHSGFLGRLLIPVFASRNHRSFHFLLVAVPTVGIWFAALGVSTMAFGLNGAKVKSNYPNQISALWTAFLLALLFHTDLGLMPLFHGQSIAHSHDTQDISWVLWLMLFFFVPPLCAIVLSTFTDRKTHIPHFNFYDKY